MEQAAKIGLSVLVFFFLMACKKSEERRCFKGHGEETVREIQLDSVRYWHLGPRMKYRIIQDTSRKILVKGGENMVGLISAEQNADSIKITSGNRCHFLRDNERKVEVEIHYPYFGKFYIEPSDSVIFEETIVADTLMIEMREGGGVLTLDVDAVYMKMVVSIGTSDFHLSGHAQLGDVKIQEKGFGNALDFTADQYSVYQNSRVDLPVNLEGANATVLIDGTGDVKYTGTPVQVVRKGPGSGQLIQM
ncbi:DUF2807 domain-containing protein [Paracrocinitomix mangrovi]|uniref:GIN domain-containing protein n=1 Tax=Paracrocinitomix mangrovi TaxID=2862509 RepID=UPI001C8DDF29|nr:DUF2807 domain-containing protein [Paracrocinitomix mangrovi]UKN01671.1 DUF2807 domain-containing protein [Paracrocinitomix mangrovi]